MVVHPLHSARTSHSAPRRPTNSARNHSIRLAYRHPLSRPILRRYTALDTVWPAQQLPTSTFEIIDPISAWPLSRRRMKAQENSGSGWVGVGIGGGHRISLFKSVRSV